MLIWKLKLKKLSGIPPSVAKFYPVNRTNHAEQSEKQKDSEALTAKWGVPLYLVAPSWNTCAFYAARHRRPPSNCWPSLGLWKKNGCRRASYTYGKCTPEKIHLIIWAHFKFPPELFPDVAQEHFVGQSRSDCTWNGKCVFTVNPFGQYTNLPKINTLFFNCTSISCCCENNLLRCVNQVFFGLRHYTKTHVETVRSRQATDYFDEKKTPSFKNVLLAAHSTPKQSWDENMRCWSQTIYLTFIGSDLMKCLMVKLKQCAHWSGCDWSYG